MFKEFDEIKIIKDIKIDESLIKEGTLGIILSIEKDKDKIYYIVELYDTEFDTPVFEFTGDQLSRLDK